MALTTARAIFALPPFPGAKPHPVVRIADAGAKTGRDIAPSALIGALRRHRVGGAFWQPAQGPSPALSDPWSAQAAREPLRADDPLALLRAMIGQAVMMTGDGPFAALSGLDPASPPAQATLEAMVAHHLLDGLSWHDPFDGAPSDPLTLADTLGSWRRLIDANRGIAAAFGFAHWKRDTVDPLLWGGAPVRFRPAREAELDALPSGATVAVWKARVPAGFLARLEAGPWRVLEVEDGFIRSAGLGADCVPPLSIVIDDLGVHYDPARPNRLEQMLADHEPDADDIERAQRLRAWLVREGVSKYGVGTGPAIGAAMPRPAAGRRQLLAIGQVEDDRSVRYGGGAVQTNLELLRRVRALAPDAWIVYRPHPDVEAGHRRGAIPQRVARAFADAIEPNSPIGALIATADEVHVITSLAGFEALLQGKSVTTHGTPFFAGWGLTHDLGPVPARRGAARSLDALVGATLLRYPRYLDPVTNLPCTAEILVARLLSGVNRRNGALVPARRLFGWMRRSAMQLIGMQ
jgi:capsular polysaccharide export protein